MSNLSGLTPAGHRILVLPQTTERKTESGIIFVDQYADREDMKQVEATIIAVGQCAWKDQPSPWAKAGDRVMIAKYAGLVHKGTDGQTYRVISDLDVVGVLTND